MVGGWVCTAQVVYYISCTGSKMCATWICTLLSPLFSFRWLFLIGLHSLLFNQIKCKKSLCLLPPHWVAVCVYYSILYTTHKVNCCTHWNSSLNHLALKLFSRLKEKKCSCHACCHSIQWPAKVNFFVLFNQKKKQLFLFGCCRRSSSSLPSISLESSLLREWCK